MTPTDVTRSKPGKRLGWRTDATEETQYILAGTGELRMENGSKHRVGPGSVFVIPTPGPPRPRQYRQGHLARGCLFAAAMFTQQFDNVMLPPDVHLLGTPDRAA